MDERAEYHVFPLIFLSHVFENFHWKLIVVSEKLCYEEKYMDKPGGNASFRQICFCLISSKKFIENSSVFYKISVTEKIIWMGEGDITFFRRYFLSHITANFI